MFPPIVRDTFFPSSALTRMIHYPLLSARMALIGVQVVDEWEQSRLQSVFR